MFRLEFEFEIEEVEGQELHDPPAASDSGTQLLEALTEWWARTVATPYMDINGAERLDPITIEWNFLNQTTSFQVEFDFNLLERLFEIYAAFGWGAVEEIGKTLAARPKAAHPSKEFFRLTQNAVAVMVAYGLVELEEQASSYALKEWTAARERLVGYLAAFKVVRVRVEHYGLANRQLADELFKLCREYAIETAKALRLQKEIDIRNRKDPPSTRIRGSGAELWFEVFAAPQREALNRMADLFGHIAEKFPAAVLVLDQLPESVLNASTVNQRVIAQSELEGLIHSTLQNLVAGLRALEDSLRMPGATGSLVELLKPFTANSRDFTSLRTMRVESGGFEKAALDVVLTRTEEGEQRILANLDLLSSFYDDAEESSRGTWQQIVLFRYVDRLAEVVDERRKHDEFWRAFWAWVARIAALTALLALLAVFPFGEGAVAPALASALALCATGAAVLGVVTLIHDLLSGLENAGQLEVEARDKFFRLAQTNPDAIREVGELLSRSRALRDAVSKGLLFTVLTLGAAHKLRAVALALNCEGFVSDVQTLFEPDPSPDG